MELELADNFIKIRLKSLHPSEPVPFDIYVRINNRYVHYLRAGDRITTEKVDNFELKAPEAFFIRSSDRQTYKGYVHGRLSSENLSRAEKAQILRESSFSLVAEMFENPDVHKALDESRQIIMEFVGFMNEEPSGMADLIGLSSHDFYTYNHSLDVCIYSLGLGALVGYTGADLKELGRGALFHDIGKKYVNIDIITKEGPLTDEEWAQMRMHPTWGLQILNEYNVSDDMKACCFEHHENRVGNGYPQGLEGEEIHPMARIVAIADTYDALTTKRSYNDPMTPTDALNFMKEKLANRFDRELLDSMYSVLFKMQKNKAS